MDASNNRLPFWTEANRTAHARWIAPRRGRPSPPSTWASRWLWWAFPPPGSSSWIIPSGRGTCKPSTVPIPWRQRRSACWWASWNSSSRHPTSARRRFSSPWLWILPALLALLLASDLLDVGGLLLIFACFPVKRIVPQLEELHFEVVLGSIEQRRVVLDILGQAARRLEAKHSVKFYETHPVLEA